MPRAALLRPDRSSAPIGQIPLVHARPILSCIARAVLPCHGSAFALGGGFRALALSVGIPRPGVVGAGDDDRRQGGQRRRAHCAERHRQCARSQAGRSACGAGGAGGAAGGLWPASSERVAVHRVARGGVFARDTRRGAQDCAAGVRPSVQPEHALPPGAPDRRHVARYGAGHAGHLQPGVVHPLQYSAHLGGNGAGHRHSAGQVRHLVRGHRAGGAGAVCGVHRHRDRMAHAATPRNEHAGFARQPARHRCTVEL